MRPATLAEAGVVNDLVAGSRRRIRVVVLRETSTGGSATWEARLSFPREACSDLSHGARIRRHRPRVQEHGRDLSAHARAPRAHRHPDLGDRRRRLSQLDGVLSAHRIRRDRLAVPAPMRTRRSTPVRKARVRQNERRSEERRVSRRAPARSATKRPASWSPGAQTAGYRTFEMLIAAVDGGEVDAAAAGLERTRIRGRSRPTTICCGATPRSRSSMRRCSAWCKPLIGVRGATIEGIGRGSFRPGRTGRNAAACSRSIPPGGEPSSTTRPARSARSSTRWIGASPQSVRRVAAPALRRRDPGRKRAGQSAKLHGASFLIRRGALVRRSLGRACVALRARRPAGFAAGRTLDVRRRRAQPALSGLTNPRPDAGPVQIPLLLRIRPGRTGALEAALARIDGESRILGAY